MVNFQNKDLLTTFTRAKYTTYYFEKTKKTWNYCYEYSIRIKTIVLFGFFLGGFRGSRMWPINENKVQLNTNATKNSSTSTSALLATPSTSTLPLNSTASSISDLSSRTSSLNSVTSLISDSTSHHRNEAPAPTPPAASAPTAEIRLQRLLSALGMAVEPRMIHFTRHPCPNIKYHVVQVRFTSFQGCYFTFLK